MNATNIEENKVAGREAGRIYRQGRKELAPKKAAKSSTVKTGCRQAVRNAKLHYTPKGTEHGEKQQGFF
jgi:hypothetical protein